MMKQQKKQVLVISSDDEPKLIQQPQQKKRLIRNDFEELKEELKKTEIQLRKRKIIYDDESDDVQKQTTEETMEGKKKFKLIKKQEIIIQAAQQEATTCPICFCDLDKLQVVILECSHMFCQTCVKTQCEKYQNNCPLCRKPYKNYTICIRGEDGEYMRGQLIKVKRKIKQFLDENESDEEQQFVQLSESSFVQDSQYDAGDSFIVQDDECCEVCQGQDNMEAMLFCKSCASIVRHSYCQAIHPGRVLCSSCRNNQHR